MRHVKIAWKVNNYVAHSVSNDKSIRSHIIANLRNERKFLKYLKNT